MLVVKLSSGITRAIMRIVARVKCKGKKCQHFMAGACTNWKRDEERYIDN